MNDWNDIPDRHRQFVEFGNERQGSRQSHLRNVETARVLLAPPRISIPSNCRCVASLCSVGWIIDSLFTFIMCSFGFSGYRIEKDENKWFLNEWITCIHHWAMPGSRAIRFRVWSRDAGRSGEIDGESCPGHLPAAGCDAPSNLANVYIIHNLKLKCQIRWRKKTNLWGRIRSL